MSTHLYSYSIVSGLILLCFLVGEDKDRRRWLEPNRGCGNRDLRALSVLPVG